MTERTILHVDMDSFFASVEVLLDPSLRGRPVIVGGAGDRGVVASCTYEARVHGIHSAMPSVRARRLCPDAVFVHGHYDLYSSYSSRLHEVLQSFTPWVEGISLDEAFLDVTGARRLFGDGEEIAWQIRARVKQELDLTCCVGVAATKFVAKLASKAAKPRIVAGAVAEGPGVFVVAPGRELEFLHPLPIGALWGVGPATAERLGRYGVTTVGDLSKMDVKTLQGSLGVVGRHLHQLSLGLDPRAVEPDRGTKSIGHEETYSHDHHDHASLDREIVRMADAVASRMRSAGLSGRTVQLKVRYHDFKTITRSRTLPSPVDTAPSIGHAASELLADLDVSVGVRLLGVSVSNLVSGAARQLSLDDLSAEGDWIETSAAIDAIRSRFGSDAVGPASLLDSGALRVKKVGQQQWGPTGRTDR